MKKLFTLLVVSVLALMMLPTTSRASHMAGMDLTYEYTGVANTYLLRLKYYRDCTGIPVPTIANILGFDNDIPSGILEGRVLNEAFN